MFYAKVIEQNFNTPVITDECVEIFNNWVLAKYVNLPMPRKIAMATMELNRLAQLENVVTPENIVILLENEFDDKYWDNYRRIENERKKIKVGKEPNTTVPCRKCGIKAVYLKKIQLRALDEPTTKFYNCLKCDEVWRD